MAHSMKLKQCIIYWKVQLLPYTEIIQTFISKGANNNILKKTKSLIKGIHYLISKSKVPVIYMSERNVLTGV